MGLVGIHLGGEVILTEKGQEGTFESAQCVLWLDLSVVHRHIHMEALIELYG